MKLCVIYLTCLSIYLPAYLFLHLRFKKCSQLLLLPCALSYKLRNCPKWFGLVIL